MKIEHILAAEVSLEDEIAYIEHVVRKHDGEEWSEELSGEILRELEFDENEWTRNALGQAWQDFSCNGGRLDPSALIALHIECSEG